MWEFVSFAVVGVDVVGVVVVVEGVVLNLMAVFCGVVVGPQWRWTGPLCERIGCGCDQGGVGVG